MEIGWLLPLVAVVEITGGLLVIFPKTRALGAIIILPVMVGIVLHNLKDTTGLPIAAPLALINLWMLDRQQQQIQKSDQLNTLITKYLISRPNLFGFLFLNILTPKKRNTILQITHFQLIKS